MAENNDNDWFPDEYGSREEFDKEMARRLDLVCSCDHEWESVENDVVLEVCKKCKSGRGINMAYFETIH